MNAALGENRAGTSQRAALRRGFFTARFVAALGCCFFCFCDGRVLEDGVAAFFDLRRTERFRVRTVGDAVSVAGVPPGLSPCMIAAAEVANP